MPTPDDPALEQGPGDRPQETVLKQPSGDRTHRTDILFIAIKAYASFGGLQRFNRRVIDALGEVADSEVLIAEDKLTDIPGSYRGRCRGFGGTTWRLALTALMAARRSRVLLVGHRKLMPLAWLMKRLNPRLKVILFVHGIEVWGEAPYRRPARHEPWLMRTADRIASVSRHTAERMGRSFGVDAARFTIFPNAVDLPDDGEETAPSPTPLSFLCVSRLTANEREKNVEEVIEAFARLVPDHPGIHLDIVGDGPRRAGLEALAQDLGIAAQVHFHGRVEDTELVRLYAQARAFVLPSSKEGFGIVYLEAWLHRLPVICSRFGAAPEVVSDGVDGYAVDPADIEALAGHMGRLAADADLCARLGEAGHEKVTTHYLQQNFARNLATLLAEVA